MTYVRSPELHHWHQMRISPCNVELQAFSERLRECDEKVRLQEGLSLGKRTGDRSISSHMDRLLRGKQNPKYTQIIALAKAAGVRPAWLAFGDGERHEKSPDDWLRFLRSEYTQVPTINQFGVPDEKVWGALRTEELQNCIPEFPKTNLAFFRVMETVRGPKFVFGQWLLIDTNAPTEIETADYCLKARAVGRVFARQVTLNYDGSVTVISPRNGQPPEVEHHDRDRFWRNYEVVGRILVSGKWSVFDGPPFPIPLQPSPERTR